MKEDYTFLYYAQKEAINTYQQNVDYSFFDLLADFSFIAASIIIIFFLGYIIGKNSKKSSIDSTIDTSNNWKSLFMRRFK